MQSRCAKDTLKVRSQGLHAEYPHQHSHTVLLGSGPTFALWSNCAAGGLLEIGLLFNFCTKRSSREETTGELQQTAVIRDEACPVFCAVQLNAINSYPNI